MKIPRISETEWLVMKVVWTSAPITASEILAVLAQSDATWHPKTARTLLARLVRKKALHARAYGKTYYYTPAVCEAECLAAKTSSFLDEYFGGSLQPLVAHFLNHRKVSSNELEQLRRILDKAPSNSQPAKKS